MSKVHFQGARYEPGRVIEPTRDYPKGREFPGKVWVWYSVRQRRSGNEEVHENKTVEAEGLESEFPWAVISAVPRDALVDITIETVKAHRGRDAPMINRLLDFDPLEENGHD